MLLDTGSTLAADHALVHRMIAIAFDIANGSVFEIDFDPAAAGAHVTGGRFRLVPCFRRASERRFSRHGRVSPCCGFDSPLSFNALSHAGRSLAWCQKAAPLGTDGANEGGFHENLAISARILDPSDQIAAKREERSIGLWLRREGRGHSGPSPNPNALVLRDEHR